MLRKTLYSCLALTACVLIVAAFDVARHAAALLRLDKRHLDLTDWHYRFVSGDTGEDPREAKGRLVVWWR